MRKSILVVLAVIALLLSACGPAMVPATAPETESGEIFEIALPRIVITFDANGTPGIEGLPLEEIANSLGYPIDLSLMRINPFYVNWMTAANVQHIELRQTGTGLAVLINGKPMPHVGWTDDSLKQTADLAPLFLLQEDLLKKFVPVVTRLGLDIVLKFPVGADVEPIPYATDEVALAAAMPTEEPPSAVVHFEIRYDAQGVPAILGISARDLAALGLYAPLALDPSYVGLLQANNIQHMELRSKADGVFVYINDVPVPNVVWDKDMLSSAVSVWAQMNPGVGENYIKLIKQFAPMLSNADVAIMVHFPLAAGAEPIPAKMH